MVLPTSDFLPARRRAEEKGPLGSGDRPGEDVGFVREGAGVEKRLKNRLDLPGATAAQLKECLH